MLRQTVAGALHYSGIISLMHRCTRRSLVIPCYHRVLPRELCDASPMPVLAITPQAFAGHLAFFRRRYECLPLDEAMARLQDDGHHDRPLLSVTFDDGYRDNHEYALPLLREHGIRATFFVISSLVGTNWPPWYDRLARASMFLKKNAETQSGMAHVLQGAVPNLVTRGSMPAVGELVEQAKRLDANRRHQLVDAMAREAADRGWKEPETDRIMTPEQLRKLSAEGHEIGAHTRTHPILPSLEPEDCMSELAGARKDLEQLVGVPVNSLAYPNGDHDDGVVAAAREAGYRHAVTTQPGRNHAGGDPFRLSRFFIGEKRYQGSSGEFASHVMAMQFVGVLDAFQRPTRRAATQA